MAMKLQIIDWEDHDADSGWQDTSDIASAPPTIIRSIGWVAHETKKAVTLGGAYSIAEMEAKGEGWGSTQRILKSCIVGRWDVEID